MFEEFVTPTTSGYTIHWCSYEYTYYAFTEIVKNEKKTSITVMYDAVKVNTYALFCP